ncbi:hypothetical protein BgiMline_033066 [Biomphalaria glabrata]
MFITRSDARHSTGRRSQQTWLSKALSPSRGTRKLYYTYKAEMAEPVDRESIHLSIAVYAVKDKYSVPRMSSKLTVTTPELVCILQLLVLKTFRDCGAKRMGKCESEVDLLSPCGKT